MASITLGSSPDILRVILVKDADFVSSLRRKDGEDWPNDVSLVLEFSTGDEWSAEFSGPTAIWEESETTVNTLLDARPVGVKLWYIEGDLRLLWAFGEVDARRE